MILKVVVVEYLALSLPLNIRVINYMIMKNNELLVEK